MHPVKMGEITIAKGDVSFAANANGIEGASIIAGGQISGTSNMTMGFCGQSVLSAMSTTVSSWGSPVETTVDVS
jgi:hypothetical protein